MKFSTSIATILFLLFAQFTIAQNALSFDGIDDKVDLGNGPNLQLSGTTLTIEAWIYPTSWRTNVWEGGIVVKEQNIQAGYMFRAGNSGRLNFAFGSGGAGAVWKELTTAANALSLNVWQHVAATYDGAKVRLYKNGVRIDSMAYTGAIGANTNNCVIGGWYTTGRNFPGKIDEVRIWNVKRTGAQLLAAMNGEFCGAIPGLKAYYKFNQGTAGGANAGLTTLTDAAGTSTGTLQNFTLSGATSNWVTGATLTPGTGGSGTLTTTACDSYTSASGQIWTTSGTYVDTVTSALGCDSILTVNLTVKNSSTGTLTATGCNNYTSPSGNHTWTSSGTYTDIIPNAAGCDSTITITLTILTIDINVLQNGASLTSWAIGAAYQWLDCGNGFASIPGANSQTFFPTVNGSYAVQVSKNGCTDTTACYTVTGIGVAENTDESLLAVYPNPAKNFTVLQLHKNYKQLNVSVVGVTGQTLAAFSAQNTSTLEMNFNLPRGLYFLNITADGKQFVKKLLVE